MFSLSLSSPAVPLSSQTVRAKLDSLAAKAMQALRMPEPSLVLNSLMGLYYALPGHFDDLIEPGTHVDWTDDQSDIGDFGKVEGRHRTTSDVIRMRAAANCSGAAVAKFRRAPPWSSN